MKSLKSLGVVVAVLLASMQVEASSTVVFKCDLEDGNSVMVEHETLNNEFTLTYGLNLDAPKITIRKQANNLGTSLQASHAEGSINRELYVTDGDYFYDVGYTDQRGIKKGYFQIMIGGAERSYGMCKRETLYSTFDDYELFSDMTEVD